MSAALVFNARSPLRDAPAVRDGPFHRFPAACAVIVTALCQRLHEQDVNPAATEMDTMQPPASPCLLLVDDDPMVRALLTVGMEDQGFTVVEAASGEAAMALLDGGLSPSVVVTDIDLGGGCSGVELADRLLHSHPGLRVILISGRGRQQGDAAQRPFLVKPFPLATLSRLAHGAPL
ncbi:response regulator [Roseomonas haemaphysalidis]|uniref:Response regulator n=1 Tax=Roseomonas haemaphysalidis TaxID=2768162 RepID=A0ABS3KQB9_9PROT|nr:response regulator [Roseomonas haemaphysalidis]MBO1078783.1 response regulator [Roseomonas haemaphysalidis]